MVFLLQRSSPNAYRLPLQQKAGQQGKESGALAAAADNKSDAFVSIGTFIGITAVQFQLAWIDTVTAFVIGLLICKTAWDIFKESSHSWTDGFDVKDISAYKQTIENISGVSRLKDIKERYPGSTFYVDVVVGVSADLNITESRKPQYCQ